jgi:hypothetical protein
MTFAVGLMLCELQCMMVDALPLWASVGSPAVMSEAAIVLESGARICQALWVSLRGLQHEIAILRQSSAGMLEAFRINLEGLEHEITIV